MKQVPGEQGSHSKDRFKEFNSQVVHHRIEMQEIAENQLPVDEIS